MKDIYSVKSEESKRPGIYRGMSAQYAVSIVNSRIIEYDDKGEPIHPEEFDPDALERGLKSRHVQLIALGGCIGTGLFVGTGSALRTCGPAALLTSYLIMSIVMFFVMNMLGEMATFLPLPGGAMKFVTDYVDPSLGFANGYNYWYTYAMLVASEVTAAAIVVQYWNKSISIAVWITIFLAVIILLNISSVKYFGEAEFWFAGIKLITITGLIIVGIVIFFGGAPTHDRLGFRFWKTPGAFVEHLRPGNTGKFLAVWTAIIKSGFAFICSPELVAVCGAECVSPRRNIPKAAGRFIYRLSFFYIGGTLIIGVIVASNDPRLLGATLSDASASPFVIGIQNAGIKILNHIINAAILTSAASSGNAFLYSSSRTLYGLSTSGLAPKIFSKTNRMGIPYYAVGVSCLFGFLAYLNVQSSSANVFNWFSNICTISGFVSWLCLSIAYIRWRKAIEFHGLSDRVTYRTILQPYGAYFVLIFIGLVTLTNGYAVFFAFTGSDFVAAYITLPIFFVLYVGHKLYNYFVNGVTDFVTPLEKIRFDGLEMIEEEDRLSPERLPQNFMEKIWYWIA